MRLLPFFIFLTFVGTAFVANAAPNSDTPKPGLPKSIDQSLGDYPTSEPLALRPLAEYTFQAHFGTIGGDLFDENTVMSTSYFGGLFSWRDQAEHAWDFQTDASSSSSLVIVGLSRRTELPLGDFAAYWKIGAQQTMQGSSMLANLTDIKKLKAFAAIGFANLFNMDRHINFDFRFGTGMIGAEFSAQIGWVWDL